MATRKQWWRVKTERLMEGFWVANEYDYKYMTDGDVADLSLGDANTRIEYTKVTYPPDAWLRAKMEKIDKRIRKLIRERFHLSHLLNVSERMW